MMNYRRMSMVSTLTAALVILAIFAVDDSSAHRYNGVFTHCGSDAEHFMKWFCRDPNFRFPFPFNRIYLILRYGPPHKILFPYQHQAWHCCRMGCDESGYRKMCHYHRKLKVCERRRRHLHVSGRAKRFFQSACLLKN